jgi:hypothetical protein
LPPLPIYPPHDDQCNNRHQPQHVTNCETEHGGLLQLYVDYSDADHLVHIARLDWPGNELKFRSRIQEPVYSRPRKPSRQRRRNRQDDQQRAEAVSHVLILAFPYME